MPSASFSSSRSYVRRSRRKNANRIPLPSRTTGKRERKNECERASERRGTAWASETERERERRGHKESLSLRLSLFVSKNFFQDLAAHLSVLCSPSPISFGSLNGSRVSHVVLTTSSTHSAISVESLSRRADLSTLSRPRLSVFNLSNIFRYLYQFYFSPFHCIFFLCGMCRKDWKRAGRVNSNCISGGEKETLVFLVTICI